ncbi:MAG: hypothetical protein ACM3PV_07425, partial [Betaproteobacteria bacterium]
MGESDPLAALLDSIAAEFEVPLGRPERVEADCARLRERLTLPPTQQELERLGRLAPLLRQRTGPIAAPLFDLLEEQTCGSDDPWPLVEALLRSRDGTLARRALETAGRLAEAGSLTVDRRAVQLLADEVERPGSPLGEGDALAAIARLLRRPRTEARDPVLALYLEPAGARVRGLAARLLDLDGQPVPAAMAEVLLGPEAHAF